MNPFRTKNFIPLGTNLKIFQLNIEGISQAKCDYLSKMLADAAHYHPISLLSCVFKLLERMVLTRIQPTIENAIPKEQAAGFRLDRSCTDQVMTNKIESGFQRKLRSAVAFTDLSATLSGIMVSY